MGPDRMGMRIAVAGGTGVVGRYVVEAARAAGHEPVVISRAAGVDLESGAGLADALAGVQVIVDASNPRTTNGAKAAAFFTGVAGRLQGAGTAAGVARVVTLSIVGLEQIPNYGYYQAKLAQEQAVLAGPLPVTIVRATQFFEFPAQLMAYSRKGPVALVPRMRIQPAAARAVAGALVAVAEDPAITGTVEVAGPEVADLVTLARALVRRHRQRIAVVPLRLPGAAAKAMRTGGQLPSADARIVGPRFAEWLEGEDSLRPEF